MTTPSYEDTLQGRIAAGAESLTQERAERQDAQAAYEDVRERIQLTGDRLSRLTERLRSAKSPEVRRRLRAKRQAAEAKITGLKEQKAVLGATFTRERAEQVAAKSQLDILRGQLRAHKDYMSRAQLEVPWLPAELVDVFAQKWAELGDAEQATNAVRQDSRYEKYYPGIKREDGSLRMSELEYNSGRARFMAILDDPEYGLNPDLFAHKYADLVEGEVSMDEFQTRIEMMYQRIATQSNAIRATYRQWFGDAANQLTVGGMLAMAMDPDVSRAVLDRRMTIAEIGGSARAKGFTITQKMAERLANRGFGLDSGQELFDAAALQLPGLARAARRQSPDQGYGLAAFLRTQAFAEPDDIRRLQRILAGEASDFSERSGLSLDQLGAQRGLRPR